MGRLTITLDDDLLRALREIAAQEGRSVSSVVESSLRLQGIGSQANARALVNRARQRAQLDPGEAITLAVRETRRAR
ncbi:MAG: DUF6364 family protein [Pseudomonadales bacterium]